MTSILDNRIVCISEKILNSIRAFEDTFSQELINLWDSRKLQGKIFYILNSKREPVGYILLEEQLKYDVIRGFYVKSDYRNLGYGTHLLEVVDDYVKSLPKNVLVNITKGAEGVYVREGYKLLGPREDFPDQIRAIREHAKQNSLRSANSICFS